MVKTYDASPSEALGIASDIIDELAAEGLTQADILHVLTTGLVTWAGDFERTGNKGSLPRSVRTQPQAIKEAGRILLDLGTSYEQRRKRTPQRR